MTKISGRVPPLSGLLAFEAALRHGSMTLAADELGLTQSAVSHRIRSLEDFFGMGLLERLNPGLRATEAGALLSRELLPTLGALAGLMRRIIGQSGARVFRLGLSTPLLAWWLSPRLPALREAFPDLLVEIVTWDSPAEAARSEVDLALLWMPRGTANGGSCELAFPDEHVLPVAAPKLLKASGVGRDWQSLPLLAKGRRGEETGREWSWGTWLGATPAFEAIRFRDIGSSLQAAVDGNGAALGRSLLVADALSQRRLVRLVPSSQTRICSKAQIARWRDPYDQTAARMADWLIATAGQVLRTEHKALKNVASKDR
ncbi:LysR family transcriptional regulator [Variovorax sp. H27-G14]|uniref:LysR family transcriptional regulator n=1 Tax=Variovorax sp. H27-G14 TaxID=3111914 RepID=UPI0038FC3C93